MACLSPGAASGTPGREKCLLLPGGVSCEPAPAPARVSAASPQAVRPVGLRRPRPGRGRPLPLSGAAGPATPTPSSTVLRGLGSGAPRPAEPGGRCPPPCRPEAVPPPCSAAARVAGREPSGSGAGTPGRPRSVVKEVGSGRAEGRGSRERTPRPPESAGRGLPGRGCRVAGGWFLGRRVPERPQEGAPRPAGG